MTATIWRRANEPHLALVREARRVAGMVVHPPAFPGGAVAGASELNRARDEARRAVG